MTLASIHSRNKHYLTAGDINSMWDKVFYYATSAVPLLSSCSRLCIFSSYTSALRDVYAMGILGIILLFFCCRSVAILWGPCLSLLSLTPTYTLADLLSAERAGHCMPDCLIFACTCCFLRCRCNTVTHAASCSSSTLIGRWCASVVCLCRRWHSLDLHRLYWQELASDGM
jgi:hypothetical protein